MEIETTRFGKIEVNDNKILNFVAPIIGYNEYSKYTIIEHGDNEIFKWLQSVEDPELAFPISVPLYFDIDYVFELDDSTAEKLGIKEAKDLLIFNIVTIPNNNPTGATINLLAPIVINSLTNDSLQYIITNSSYSSRYPLFK